MNKFLSLLFVALLGSASAFTTVQPRTISSMRPAAVVAPVAAPQSSTSLNLVDPAITAMTDLANPVGSIVALCVFVSVWEILTPGRAKKP